MTDKRSGKKMSMGRNLEIDDSLLPGAVAPTPKAPESHRSVSFKTPVRMPPAPPNKETKKATSVAKPPERLGPQERPTVQMEASELHGSVFEAEFEPQNSGDSWFKYAAFFAFGFLIATIIALSTSPTVPNVPLLDSPVKPDSEPGVGEESAESIATSSPGKDVSDKQGPQDPLRRLEPNALPPSSQLFPAKERVPAEKPVEDAAVLEKKVAAVTAAPEKNDAAPPVVAPEKKAKSRVAVVPAPEKNVIDLVRVRNPGTRHLVVEKKTAPKRVIMPFMVTARVPLKLRKGPKQDTKRVGGVPAGAEIYAMGRKPRSAFIKVRHGKKVGWIAYIRGFVVFPEGRTIGDLPVVQE